MFSVGDIDLSKVSKKRKIWSGVVILVLFIIVCWWYNKDNDQTQDIVDQIKKEQTK